MIRRYPFHALLLLVLLVGWILLSFYNVLVDDDLVFLRLLQEKGIAEATHYQYDTWNTRWMSFLWLHLWMGSFTPTGSLLPYHFFTLAALIAVSYRSVRALQILNWVREGSAADTLFMATLMAFAIIVSSYHIGDTWFWVNTSTMYGWNLVFILWAFSIVLLPYKIRLINSVLLVICGLYTGGASEPAVASLILLASTGLILGKIPSRYRTPILIFMLSMVCSFSIAYMGEGHVQREKALPDAGLIRWAGLSAWYFIRIIIIESPVRWILIIALLWPLRHQELNKRPHTVPSSLNLILGYVLTVGVHSTSLVAIMGDYGPPRSLSFIGLMTVMALIGLIGSMQARWIQMVGRLAIFPSILLASWIMIRQAQALPAYRKYACEVIEGKRKLEPDQIPDSGLLHRISFNE